MNVLNEFFESFKIALHDSFSLFGFIFVLLFYILFILVIFGFIIYNIIAYIKFFKFHWRYQKNESNRI